jgi:hypothetical protein
MVAGAPVASSKAEEQILSSESRTQLSRQLESIAETLSTSLTTREFRLFAANQLGASPKRNAIALEDFIAVAARQGPRNNVEGLFTLARRAQDAESMMRGAAMPMPRLDLELPVDTYRSMLQTSESVYVAVDPLVDEIEAESITAFSDGRRITLSADTPPDLPTIVIKPAEMESLEPTYPLPFSEQPEEEARQGRITDDFVGIPQILITNDHEPWYRGNPEIIVRYRRFLTTGVFQDLKRDLPSVNDEDKWYSLGDPNDTYLFFDGQWDAEYETVVWEDDGPDDDDLVGVFIINWQNLPFGGYDGPRSNKDARVRLDRD